MSTKKSGPKGGRPQIYADDLFTLTVMIGSQMNLGARGIAGVLASLNAIYGLKLPTPHYTTIARRAKALSQAITHLVPPRGRMLEDCADARLDEVFVHFFPGQNSGICDIAIGGTGLSVRGPGLYRLAHSQSKTERLISRYMPDLLF